MDKKSCFKRTINFESKILDDLTFEREGYHPVELGNTSAKMIWAVCYYCGEPHKLRKGNFTKLGYACHKNCNMEQLNNCYDVANPEIREKREKTCLEKYGTKSPTSSEEVRKKISETKLTEESKEKYKNTCREKYGVDYAFQAEMVKAKIQESLQKKYGVKSPLKNKEIKEKAQNTCKERFGVKSLLELSEIREKSQKEQETVEIIVRDKSVEELLEKYKHSDFSYIDNIKEKICDTIKNYGFDITNTTLEKTINNIKQTVKIDIYIPSKNFAIELNSNYYISEAFLEHEKARTNQHYKTNICKDNDIRLFHILETHWEERQSQIMNFINTILGTNKINIGARECKTNNDDANNFIHNNHIQANTNNPIRYFNLIYNGEIIASMTASRHHRQNFTGNPIVLSRLAFKDGYNIQGGSSKLFKAMKIWAKENNYDRILSWSDNLWTEGNIYKVLGFTLEKESSPDYLYWNSKNNKYISKQSQRKSNTNCPKEIKEADWCMKDGLFRLWNAGLKRWIYKL